MRPIGSRIKHDAHSWDQTEDVAGSVFRLSSRVRLRLALSQRSQPPHAEPHAAMSHHTNISQKPGLHQTSSLPKLYSSSSTRSPRRVTRYVCSRLTRILHTNRILLLRCAAEARGWAELSRTRHLLRSSHLSLAWAGSLRTSSSPLPKQNNGRKRPM